MRRFRFRLFCPIIPLIFTACYLFENKIDRAIDRATDYLKGKGPHIQTAMIPMLNHLKREYDLNFDLKALNENLLMQKNNPQRAFLRSLDPSIVVSHAEILKFRGIDRLTVTALYCDLYTPPTDLMQSLREMANAGGYSLTHAALALFLYKSRNCPIDTSVFSQEAEYQAQKLRFLIKRTNVASDLGIEAIVSLYLALPFLKPTVGEPLVEPAWIMKILNAQAPDGSWHQNDHTTVLAIWALLESKRNNTLH